MKSRTRIALAAITAIGLIAPAGLAMESASAESDSVYASSNSAYVVGTITDTAGHPLIDAEADAEFCVTVPGPWGTDLDDDGCYATEYPDRGYGDTDRNGRYVLSLSTNDLGEYPNADETAGYWQVIGYNDNFDESASVRINPVIGRVVAGPRLTMTPQSYTPPSDGSVVLTGVVTGAGGAPLNDVNVDAFNAATGRQIGGTRTHADGHYYFTTENDVSGNVKLEFSANTDDEGFFGSSDEDYDGYVPQWSGGGVAKSRARVIAVPAYGTGTATYNAALAPEGTITGTIKLPAAGRNWMAAVTIFDLDGNPITGSDVDAAGGFSADLAPGSYYVRADGARFTETADPSECPTCVQLGDTFGFVAGYYGTNATSLATAAKVVVTSGGNRSVGTITLTNAYQNAVKPVITRNKALKKGREKGARLFATTGTWNHQADTTYTFAWRVGNQTVGTGSSLTLTKKIWKKLKDGKKAKKLTATVTASDRHAVLVNGSVTVKAAKALSKVAKAQGTYHQHHSGKKHHQHKKHHHHN